jgi:hypothetical protein
MGGLLNDNLAPAAIWYAGGAMALLGALMFARMARGESKITQVGT